MAAIFNDLPVFVRAQWDSLGNPFPQPDGHPRWSGAESPPSIGQEVLIAANGLGPAIVVGYVVVGEEPTQRWLHVLCRLLNPPETYLKRSGGRAEIEVVGHEIKGIDNEKRSRAYAVKFCREARDCPANAEAEAKGGRLIYDYAIMINGDRRGTFAARRFSRGYWFEDLDGRGIGLTKAAAMGGGEVVRIKDDFEIMVRRALAVGAIPTVAQVDARRAAEAEAEAAVEAEREAEKTMHRQWRAILGIEPGAADTPAPDLVFRLAAQLEIVTGMAEDLREGRAHPLLNGTLRVANELIAEFTTAFPRYARPITDPGIGTDGG